LFVQVQHEFNAFRHYERMYGTSHRRLRAIPDTRGGTARRRRFGVRAAGWCLCLLAGVALAAQQPQPKPLPVGMTLEQAVAKVQNETRGKVLQADTRQLGHITEYRIKVLTPDGHVRVVPVRTEAAKAKNDKEKR
jgi:hypothetical protein